MKTIPYRDHEYASRVGEESRGRDPPSDATDARRYQADHIYRAAVDLYATTEIVREPLHSVRRKVWEETADPHSCIHGSLVPRLECARQTASEYDKKHGVSSGIDTLIDSVVRCLEANNWDAASIEAARANEYLRIAAETARMLSGI